MVKIAAIIAAAGSSLRMGAGLKKEYRALPGAVAENGENITVLGAVVSAFAADARISPIVIVHPVSAEQGEFAARNALGKRLLAQAGSARILFVPGGANRRLSVYHALVLLNAWSPDIVLIHDGARPWIERALIGRVIEGVQTHGAAIPVLPLTETPKSVRGGFVERHLKRVETFIAQTPQGFHFNELFSAHQKAAEKCLHEDREYTDDAELYDEFVGKIVAVEGDILNRKITFPYDL